MSSALTLPAQGNYTWKSPVSTSSALPALGNTLGDARVATDSSTIYLWTGITWQAVTGGGGGGGAGFTTMQTPLGTSPVATGADTLTWASTTLDITGNATTDTIALEIKDGAVTDAKVATGISGSKISGDISGNAANITATSNATLTTLSALLLLGSQVSGNISGNAANITATSNSTLTTLSALSLPTSQLTGSIGISNGGTGLSAVGAAGFLPVAQSGGTLAYERVFNPTTRTPPWGSDFIGGNVGAEMVAAASGTGALSTLDTSQTSANPGVWKLVTGTTTTGWAYISGNNSGQNLFLGGGTTYFDAHVKLSAVSDATDTYALQLGVSGTQVGTPTNGIFFTHNKDVNGGRWTLNCVKASTTTSVDTGITPSTTAYQHLLWVLNSAGTSVQAYVNGVAAGTAITTNIPIAALQPILSVLKSAGTTSRTVFLDFTYLEIVLAVAR